MTESPQLEDLYGITDNSYSTGSEWLDGLIIGLATMLLIRNAELVMLDMLTFFFGDKRQRVGFRVLRMWQMLTLNQFFNVVIGFDSDIPFSRLRRARGEKRSVLPSRSRCEIRKGRFASLLFLAVLSGKLLILGAEVAIIALVIPVAKLHFSEGGLGIQWKNATITADAVSSVPTCKPLLTSTRLSDSAQLALCTREDLREEFTAVAQNWIPNGTLRMEEIYFTRDRAAQAGGVVSELGTIFCGDESVDGTSTASDAQSQEAIRQVGFSSEPDAEFTNNLQIGEIAIEGQLARSEDGTFFRGSAGIQPIFSDAQRTLRLAFPTFFAEGVVAIGGMGPTVNGKLLLGGGVRSIPGLHSLRMCPDALEEIKRVSGTLDPGLIMDLFKLSITVKVRSNFVEPSPALDSLNTVNGFEIGSSRKCRIQPEWMGLAAALTILLSMITSRLNKTEVRMARVYREHNDMCSACSPAFLEEESVVEAGLFQRENQYHWGESPGEDWEEVYAFDFNETVVLS